MAEWILPLVERLRSVSTREHGEKQPLVLERKTVLSLQQECPKRIRDELSHGPVDEGLEAEGVEQDASSADPNLVERLRLREGEGAEPLGILIKVVEAVQLCAIVGRFLLLHCQCKLLVPRYIDFLGQPAVLKWHSELLRSKAVEGFINAFGQWTWQADSVNPKSLLRNGGVFLGNIADDGKPLVVVGGDGAGSRAAHQVHDKLASGRSHEDEPLDNSDRLLGGMSRLFIFPHKPTEQGFFNYARRSRNKAEFPLLEFLKLHFVQEVLHVHLGVWLRQMEACHLG